MDANPTWLGAVLTKHANDHNIVAVLDVKTESAVDEGDNYSSVIVRATMRVVLGSGRVTSKSIIMKKALEGIASDNKIEVFRGFHQEGVIYNEVLSKYESIINEKSLSYSKFWPDCIFTSHDKIIFEDLKASGFSLAPRQNGLDLSHVELVLVNLARLHSISLVALSKGTIFTKVLPNYFMIDSEAGQKIFKLMLIVLADVMKDGWGSQWSEVENTIRNMADNVVETIQTLYKQPHKLSVVNHGDCWVNNIMFKHNNHGFPTEQKFIDFQTSYYNSYGWDLTYFLYTSVHIDKIIANFDSFLEIYTKEFSDNLAKLGHDVSLAPTVDEVRDEMARLRPFAVAVSCILLPVTSNPGNVKVSIVEILQGSPRLRLLYEDETFEKTLQEMLTNFTNLGVL